MKWNELKYTEIRPEKMKSNHLTWNQMRKHQTKWNDMKLKEMKSICLNSTQMRSKKALKRNHTNRTSTEGHQSTRNKNHILSRALHGMKSNQVKEIKCTEKKWIEIQSTKATGNPANPKEAKWSEIKPKEPKWKKWKRFKSSNRLKRHENELKANQWKQNMNWDEIKSNEIKHDVFKRYEMKSKIG